MRPGLIIALIIFGLIPAYRSYEQSTHPNLHLPSNTQLKLPSQNNQQTWQQLLNQSNR